MFADQYGNIIGLAEMTNNYLVVEAIRWIHDGTCVAATLWPTWCWLTAAASRM